jgi:hypothetical protein
MAVDPTLDGSEVFLPIDGALYSAPVGTTLPTSAIAPLDSAFTGHGYWTSDGLTESSATSTTPLRAFQNNALVANPVTDGTATITVALLQKNVENAELFFGDTVDPATGGVRWRPGVANEDRVFVVDKIRGTHVERTVVGRGAVTATGDRVTVQGGAHSYPLTISIYDDSAVVYDTELATAGGGA